MTEHFYINCQLNNNREEPVDAQLSYNFSGAVVQKQGDYDACVMKVNVNTSSIPINHVSHLPDDMFVTLTGPSMTPVTKNLKNYFTEDDELYEVNDFIIAMNNCLDAIYAEYEVNEGKGPIDQPMHYGFDQDRQKLFVTIATSNTTTWPYRIHFNSNLFNMFGDGFNNTYNKSTKLYEMKYMNYYNYSVETPGELIKVMQDYPAISSLFECNKIILTSNLNSRSETMTMSYTNSNISVMQETLNILFDAYYSPAVARSEFIYVASTTDRSVNLLGSNTLDSIKLNVYYETKTGQKYPVKLKYGDIVNVKIKFTKKFS